MSEITNQPLYLIKFDDTEVPDETMFGAEVANKRFEQLSGNWNAHLFVKVASNSRDDSCSGSNAKLTSDYDAVAAQRDEGLERERLSGQHIKALEALNQQSAKQRDHWIEEHARLQQRLAEATDLLKHMTCSYHRALENGYDRIIFLGGDCDSVDKMENDDPFYAKARAFLASPGGACIKKSPAPALNLPRRKVKTEYSAAEEDAQADAWNAALDAVQELNR